jgi:beta-glucosidase/6-phospho-beta-glucosidase/beta-galactosidase
MYKWMARQYVRQDHLREDVESLVHQLEVIREYHQRFQQEFQKTMKADTVFGVDYYLACEIVQPDHVFPLTKTCVDTYEKEILAGHRKGLARMCVDYWNRYQLPILHTETNFFDHGSEDWGVKQLVELAQLMKFGIPVLGFTWYSLMDQFNWDDAMMGSPNDLRLHPVGLIRLPDYEPRNFTKTILPDLLDTLHDQ